MVEENILINQYKKYGLNKKLFPWENKTKWIDE